MGDQVPRHLLCLTSLFPSTGVSTSPFKPPCLFERPTTGSSHAVGMKPGPRVPGTPCMWGKGGVGLARGQDICSIVPVFHPSTSASTSTFKLPFRFGHHRSGPSHSRSGNTGPRVPETLRMRSMGGLGVGQGPRPLLYSGVFISFHRCFDLSFQASLPLWTATRWAQPLRGCEPRTPRMRGSGGLGGARDQDLCSASPAFFLPLVTQPPL